MATYTANNSAKMETPMRVQVSPFPERLSGSNYPTETTDGSPERRARLGVIQDGQSMKVEAETLPVALPFRENRKRPHERNFAGFS